jgi:Protein of unknown function (DUF2490)
MKSFWRCKRLAFIMLLANLKYGYSQQAIVWNAIQLPVQLSAKWQVPFDCSYRTIGISASAYQYSFRTGIRRFLNDKWSVASGLAFFFTRTSFKKADHEFGKEFRLWQEALVENRLDKKFVLQNRLRLEERFFDATSKKEAFTSLRFRYRIGLIRLINEKWRLQLANEFMEQLISGQFSFQQNRANISCAYLLNPLTQIQFGYIWSQLKASAQHFITLSFQKTIVFHGNKHQ